MKIRENQTRNHLVLIVNVNENQGHFKDFFDKIESNDYLKNENLKVKEDYDEVEYGKEDDQKEESPGNIENDHENGQLRNENGQLRNENDQLMDEKRNEKLNEKLKSSFNVKLHYFTPKINQSNHQQNQIHFQCLEMLDGILFEIINLKTYYFSIIGLGYGGLYARYLVGLLNERGLFHLVTPVHFITIDTPHLGNVLLDKESQDEQGANKNLTKNTAHFFSSLFSTFHLSQNNNIRKEMDSCLNFVPPSKNEPPLLLKLCETFFLNPLKRFQSRTLFSPVNLEPLPNHSHPHLTLTTNNTTAKSTSENSIIRTKSLSRNHSDRKKTYQTSSISRTDFPLETLESQTSLPSLILDTRSISQSLSEEPEEMADDGLAQKPILLSSKETQSLVRQKLEQLDWRRVAIVAGKQRDINIHDPRFWNAKESQPLMKSILDLLYSPIHSLETTSLEEDDQVLHKKQLDSLFPLIPSISTSISTSTNSNHPNPSKPGKNTKPKDFHIVVLIHGLDGFSSDMDFIATRLRERYGTRGLRIFAPTANHYKTYDGILNGATRILQQLILELGRIRDFEGGNCCFLSVIGHSLGGMYGRCLIGLLHEEGLIPTILKPVNFITLATPHLGSREHSKYLGDKVTSMVLGSFIGLTGSELMLADEGGTDGDPFVVELSKEKFTKPLGLFTRLITYSNVRYDVPVHYSTAAIRLTPFQAPVPSTQHEKDPSQIFPVILFDSKEEPLRQENEIPKGNFEERILYNLTKTLDWKRYAVITERPFLAHIDIIIKSELWNKHGFPIIAHLIDHFRHPVRLFRKNMNDDCDGNVVVDSLNLKEKSSLHVEDTKKTIVGDKKAKSVHLVVILHGANKTSRDILTLIEKLRDSYPRPTHKIIAPDYPTSPNTISKDKMNANDTTDGELVRIVRIWLVAWTQYQISHSKIDQISIVGQGIGAIYGLDFIVEFFKNNPTVFGREIKLGSFISIDCLFTNWKIPDTLESNDIRTCLNMFDHLVMYCNSIDSACPVTPGLLIPEDDEVIISKMSRDEKFWRIVLLDSHRKRWKSEDTLANTTVSTTVPSLLDGSVYSTTSSLSKKEQKMIDIVARLKWKRFVILPPKSTSHGSFFYWNNENQNHLIAHITSFLN